MFRYPVIIDLDGKTIADFFAFYHFGRHKANTLLNTRCVKLNNVVVQSNTIIKKNQFVSIDVKEEPDYAPSFEEIDILYEDEYLLIVNKKPFQIIHGDDKSKLGSLCNAISAYFLQNGIFSKVRFAHRLDYETSGLIIFTKDLITEAYLDDQIANHTLKRYYLALIDGVIPQKGVIDKPIGDDRHNSKRKRVSDTGLRAITNYRMIENFGQYSLVECLLETGRTHQIRVHMASIGHPLLGDDLYGGNKTDMSRVALHSARVEFNHPFTNERLVICCDLPFDMKKKLEKK